MGNNSPSSVIITQIRNAVSGSKFQSRIIHNNKIRFIEFEQVIVQTFVDNLIQIDSSILSYLLVI